MFKNKNLIMELLILDKYFNKKIIKNNNILIYHYLNNILFLNNILLNNKNLNNILFLNNNKKIKFFEIEKGLKKKKLGIYLRNFSKDFIFIENAQKYCYLIIRFVRKNLFLTLLNKEGNVICKTNIGSCGFKKKVKFTGYAIKRTSKKFSKKILKLFIKTIYLIHKNYEKINIKQNLTFDLIKNLNLSLKPKKLKYFSKFKKIKKNKVKEKKKDKKKKKKTLKKIWVIFKKSKLWNKKKRKLERKFKKKYKIKLNENLFNIPKNHLSKIKTQLSKKDNEMRKLTELIKLQKNQTILNKIKKKKINFLSKKYNYLQNNINNKIIILKKGNILNYIKNKKLNYRNYLYYQNKISENFNIKIRVKSSLKFWGFKFIMYGLGKKFYWFKGLEVKIPVPHSEGLRLKKKRRV